MRIKEYKTIETITKVQQLTNLLENEITAGRYLPDSKIPSERTLGQKYNISHMTVNKAVSMLVARGILKRVQGDGTYVNRLEAGIDGQTIGVVMEMEPKDHITYIFSNLLTSYAQDKGYFLIHFDSSRPDSLEQNLPRFLAEKPHGLFLHGNFPRLDSLLKHVDAKTMLVFLIEMEYSGKKGASSVLSNFERGGMMAVEHLAKLGRKRIAVLSSVRQPGSSNELFCRGCERGIRENNLKDAVYLTSAPQAVSEDDYVEILKTPSRPDGVVSIADWRAVHFLKAARKIGLDSPADIAITGYYNTPWAEAYGLTSLSVQQDIMLEKGWKFMLNRDAGHHVLVEPKFVFRESCPAFPGAIE